MSLVGHVALRFAQIQFGAFHRSGSFSVDISNLSPLLGSHHHSFCAISCPSWFSRFVYQTLPRSRDLLARFRSTARREFYCFPFFPALSVSSRWPDLTDPGFPSSFSRWLPTTLVVRALQADPLSFLFPFVVALVFFRPGLPFHRFRVTPARVDFVAFLLGNPG